MSLLRTMMTHLGKEDELLTKGPVEQNKEVPLLPHILFVATDSESHSQSESENV